MCVSLMKYTDWKKIRLECFRHGRKAASGSNQDMQGWLDDHYELYH